MVAHHEKLQTMFEYNYYTQHYVYEYAATLNVLKRVWVVCATATAMESVKYSMLIMRLNDRHAVAYKIIILPVNNHANEFISLSINRRQMGTN